MSMNGQYVIVKEKYDIDTEDSGRPEKGVILRQEMVMVIYDKLKNSDHTTSYLAVNKSRNVFIIQPSEIIKVVKNFKGDSIDTII